ncbi:hypothetical protein MRB53_038960 [Persea americana]|nr:hypothetical protein MRB53_038960 [Persea americana]
MPIAGDVVKVKDEVKAVQGAVNTEIHKSHAACFNFICVEKMSLYQKLGMIRGLTMTRPRNEHRLASQKHCIIYLAFNTCTKTFSN